MTKLSYGLYDATLATSKAFVVVRGKATTKLEQLRNMDALNAIVTEE